MPKFLAGCHYNEEEISQHLKQMNGNKWMVQMNGNKFATGQILEKPVEVVKGRILVGWAQEPPEPWFLIVHIFNIIIRNGPWTEVDCVSGWLCSNEVGSSAVGLMESGRLE
jgi:hypothetical protein